MSRSARTILLAVIAATVLLCGMPGFVHAQKAAALPDDAKAAIQQYNESIADLDKRYAEETDRRKRVLTEMLEAAKVRAAKSVKLKQAVAIQESLDELASGEVPLAKPKPAPFVPRVPKFAINWEGHHYRIYDTPMSRRSAEATCEKLGGHLLTVDSEDE